MTNRQLLKNLRMGDAPVVINGYHISYERVIPGHTAYIVRELNQSFRSIAKTLAAIK